MTAALDQDAVGRGCSGRLDLARLLDELPAVLVVIDPDCRVRYLNRAGLQWSGRTAAEIDGLPYETLVGPTRAKVTWEYVVRALAGERVFFETAATAPDGRLVLRQVHALPVPACAPHPAAGGVLLMSTDLGPWHSSATSATAQATAQALERNAGRRVAEDLDHRVLTRLDRVADLLDAAAETGGDGPSDERLDEAMQVLEDAVRTLRGVIKGLPDPSVTPDQPPSPPLRVLPDETGVRRTTTGAAAEPAQQPGGAWRAPRRPERDTPGVVDDKGEYGGPGDPAATDSALCVLDLLPVVVGVVDRHHDTCFGNAAALAWWRRATRSDAVGRHASELMGSEAYTANRPLMDTALSGLPQTFQRTVLDRDGVVRHVVAHYLPLVLDGADPVLLVFIVDVTARVEADLAAAGGVPPRGRQQQLETARALHDLVIQRLFAVGLALRSARRPARGERHEALRPVLEGLAEARRELTESIDDLGGALEPADLVAGLSAIVADVKARAEPQPVTVQLTYVGVVRRLDPIVANSLLATVQEALGNAAVHSGGTRLEVVVAFTDGRLEVRVSDDGTGHPPFTRGAGMATLSQRARRLRGSCSWSTRPGGGTVVEWVARTGPTA